MAKARFFDLEIFETWWCCSFGDHDLQDWSDYKELGQDAFEEKVKSEMFTITSDDPNYLQRFREIFNDDEIIFSGYNIKHYDLVLVNGILKGFSPHEIKVLSDVIIDEELAMTSAEHYKMLGLAKRKYNPYLYIDMYNKLNGSLKDFEALAGLDIEESGVPFDLKRELTKEEKDKVIYYNKHDVYATMEYCRIMKQPTIEAKYGLSHTFGIPLEYTLKNTNAIASAKILGAVKQSYDDENDEILELSPRVKEYIYRNVPINVYNWLTTSKQTLEANVFGNQVVYGNGGIHSIIGENVYIEPKEDELLFNMDAVSYYPSLMIQEGLMSRSLPPIARDKFIKIFNDRLAIKYKDKNLQTKEDKLLSKAYKLVLNTTYGIMGDKFNPMYDLYKCSAVCRTGQLLLTALACRLTKRCPNTLKIIQTNTDGILILCKKTDWDVVQEEKKMWQDISGITLDTDDALRIWQRDVNNYILEVMEYDKKEKKMMPHLKIKGGWFGGAYLDPSDDTCGALYAPIIKRAAINYLVYGKDPVQELVESNNIMDFVINCKKGPGFYKVLHYRQDGAHEMNRSNRIVATKDPFYGKLVKVKRRKGKDGLYYDSENTFAQIPEHCYPMNSKITKYKFEEIKKNLDYAFYLDKIAEKLDINWVDANGNAVDKFSY